MKKLLQIIAVWILSFICLFAKDSKFNDEVLNNQIRVVAAKTFKVENKEGNTFEIWKDVTAHDYCVGGLVYVRILPTDFGEMLFISFSLQYPKNEQVGLDWTDQPYIMSFENNSWKELSNDPQNGVLGRVVARKKSKDGKSIFYLDSWTYRSSGSGWTVFSLVNGELVTNEAKTYPSLEEVKNKREFVNTGGMTEAEFAEWEKIAFAWPKSFRPFKPKAHWTTIAELVKSEQPVWRPTPIPDTKEKIIELQKTTPVISYEEFAKWLKKRE